MAIEKVKNVYQQVEQIKAMEGDVNRIDTKREFDELNKFLTQKAGKMSDEAKSYVKGLMIEYLSGDSPLTLEKPPIIQMPKFMREIIAFEKRIFNIKKKESTQIPLF